MLEIVPNWHPIAVHFPIALVSVSLALHVLAMAFRRRTWAEQAAIVARWTLSLAALSAVVTVVLGWLASTSVDHDAASHAAMQVHWHWAVAALALLVILAAVDVWFSLRHKIMPAWFALPLCIGWLLVVTTGWYGAELVYRHGVGVVALPAVEAGHDHEHGHTEEQEVLVAPLPQQSPVSAEKATHHHDGKHQHH